MPPKPKHRLCILDTSAILSGKQIDFGDAELLTVPGVSEEIRPGGRSYFLFQILLEKGLIINLPSKSFIKKIDSVALKTGDIDRLSPADKEILALALEAKEDGKCPTIVTDDYSIQNIANTLGIGFIGINQNGITKKFKWVYQCRGCRKKFKENIKTCPICGADTKVIVSKEETLT